MFGIGGSEILFIILIVLMLFGADKIPEIARTLGKGMAQLKNATNDIKQEIQNSAIESGLDKESLTGGLTKEIDELKSSYTKMIDENVGDLSLQNNSSIQDIQKEVTKLDQSFEDMTGPIKRQH